jgi:ATP-binding cassette, subfamily B, bacterial
MIRRPIARMISTAGIGRYLALTGTWIFLRTTAIVAGLLLQAIFDSLSGGPHRSHLVVWVLLAVLVGSESTRIVLWFGVVLSRLEPGFLWRLRARLRSNVLAEVLGRPAAVALDRPVGDMISRLGDDVDEASLFSIWSASNISRLVIAVAALGIMLAVNPLVTAAVIVPIVVITFCGRFTVRLIGRARLASRRADSVVAAIIGEAMNGVQAVKLARAEGRMVGRLRASGDVRLRAAAREELYIAVQTTMFTNVAALGTGAMLLVAVGQLRSGAFTIGDLAMFVFYIQFISDAANALAMFLTRTKRARLALGRIAETTGGMAGALRPGPTYVDDVPPPRPRPPAAAPGLASLTVTGLRYHYSGTSQGIRDAGFTLRAGSFTVITGRVGAGKSTLLKAILGLLPAQAGQVWWNATPVEKPERFFVPPQVAYVPQVPRLFSGSLRENVLLGLEHGDEAVHAAMRMAAFDEDLAALPDGLDTVIGPRGLRLSGGQLQRVAAARMIIRAPQLLVCDDLSNSLDVTTEGELWHRLLRDGRTVLAVSHRESLLRRADQIVLVADGTVLATGTLAELLEGHEEMRSLHGEASCAPGAGVQVQAQAQA